MNNKPKRVYAYETTDGKTFSGQDALKRSKDHQRHINICSMKKKITEEIRVILDVSELEEYDGETNEELFMERVSNGISWCEFDQFDDFAEHLIELYVLDPRMLKVFDIIRVKAAGVSL